ncbi:MAG: hypothetical protein BWY89_01876 [Bacteroidetes bacterium ADurb.BinA012]|nr:MAG: hypothetical protein BWY89_01876 [Bacteroidetes bacterium ADurb.BinA012]
MVAGLLLSLPAAGALLRPLLLVWVLVAGALLRPSLLVWVLVEGWVVADLRVSLLTGLLPAVAGLLLSLPADVSVLRVRD